jgi:hypothetical protein
MKKIEDYAHLYLGCPVLLESEMYGVGGKPDKIHERLVVIDKHGCEGEKHILYEGDFKLILRPLSDMTEEEALEVVRITRPNAELVKYKEGCWWSFRDPNDGTIYKWRKHPLEYLTPEQTRILLSKGFDLFGLIEAGLALDKTKTTVK